METIRNFWKTSSDKTRERKSLLTESPGRKKWQRNEIDLLKQMFSKEISHKSITMEEVRNRMEGFKIDASPRKVYNRIRTILSSSSGECDNGNNVCKMIAVVLNCLLI